MTKKLNDIIEIGKEKIRISNLKKIEIGLLALINTVIGFNVNAANNGAINLPKEYSENIAVKGQEKDVFDYDFNNDGINEKVVVNYNAVDNLLGAVVSIYTNQGGKDILTYQVTFDKKFSIMEIQAMGKMLDKVKEYYPEYSKNIQPGETRYITIYGDNKNSDISFDKIKFTNHSPENVNNFLFIKKASSMLDAPNGNSVASLRFSEKPVILFDMVSDSGNSSTKWYYTEFTKKSDTNVARKVKKDKNGKTVVENSAPIRGFIAGSDDNVDKRGFYWDKMVNKIEVINKFIAETGFCSRRKADELINEGRVTVNKHEAIIGMDVKPEDVVRIDGERVKLNTRYEYYILNKPKRVLCSNEDKFGRKLAVDFIKSRARLFTYGRLDFMTEGLIIISNDGDIYNHVMHPRKKLYKSYIAKVSRELEDKDIEALQYGIVIDGKRTAPAKVKKIDKKELRIAIFEGRNRQIRKMLETLGYTVNSLKRIKVGELTLGHLQVGEYRALNEDEIKYLKNL